RKKWHAGLACGRAREQGLAGSWRTAQQHALGRPRADVTILTGLAQVIDNLGNFSLDLVDARDVRESDAHAFGVNRLSLLAAQQGAHPRLLSSEDPEIEEHEEQDWAERSQQVDEEPSFLDDGSRANRGAALRESAHEIVLSEDGSLRREP